MALKASQFFGPGQGTALARALCLAPARPWPCADPALALVLRRTGRLIEHCCIMHVSWLLNSLRARHRCLNGHPSAPKVMPQCEASRPPFLKRTARD